jgi:hypothetical protein
MLGLGLGAGSGEKEEEGKVEEGVANMVGRRRPCLSGTMSVMLYLIMTTRSLTLHVLGPCDHPVLNVSTILTSEEAT